MDQQTRLGYTCILVLKMNDTKVWHFVEPSPAAIACIREIISRFSVDSLPDLPDFACRQCGREIYGGPR
jgi:hypothetical protein